MRKNILFYKSLHNAIRWVLLVIMMLAMPLLGNAQQKENAKFTIVLDAGHGGKDPGKPSKDGYKEKDIALNIVLALGEALQKDKDIEVIYTRKKDVFVDLFKRGKIANDANADLFVSVHCNAHNSQAYGAETYVLGLHRNETNFDVAKAENSVILLEDNYQETYAEYDIDSPESVIGLTLMQEEFLDQSVLLASYIQENFKTKLKRKDRSVKQAGFIVLHQTVMPSVLVETGFITNKTEGRYLNSSKGQQQMAAAIAVAIKSYKESIDTNEALGVSEIVEAAVVEDKIVDGVTFMVQLAASSRALEPMPYNFKGLTQLSRKRVGNLYKYYAGKTSNYTEIEAVLKKAKEKGYTSAFIVAYDKDNIKVPTSKVLN